jgi:2-phospho-L-lactate guanylyltransferase (CobY/MobA/RfbA family)
MSTVVPFKPMERTEARLRQRINTYRAMLEDTADFLSKVEGVNPTEERNAQAQAEAIRELLTIDKKPD